MSRAAPRLGAWAGLLGLLGLWTLAAVGHDVQTGTVRTPVPTPVPTPWAVALQLGRDGWRYYGPNLLPTLGEAVRGFLWGNGVALALAVLVLLIPALRRLVVQLATISYCVPVVAVAPLLTIIFSGRTPMVALAALSVFFTTLTGALLGLRAADRASLDVITCCGGRRWQRFRLVQLHAALPAWFASLAIAAPASLLGAVLGEWLGSVNEGLGVAMVIAMQEAAGARMWGIALVCGAVAGAGYAAIAFAGRALTPWHGD